MSDDDKVITDDHLNESEDGDNVLHVDFVTTGDIPVDRVLSKAIQAGLERVTVIGICAKCGGFYAASSQGDIGVSIVDLEICKRWLLDTAVDQVEANEPCDSNGGDKAS